MYILDKPYAGWTHVKFADNIEFYASYIEDLPLDWLEAIYDALNGHNAPAPFVLHADSEGQDHYVIVKDPVVIYVNDNDACDSVHELIYAEDIIARIVKDIEYDICLWSDWCDALLTAADLTKREMMLMSLIAKIKVKYEEVFHYPLDNNPSL